MASDDIYEWLSLRAGPYGPATEAQERVFRQYAQSKGFKDLRGFHMRLRSMGWDYIDILREFGDT